MNNRQWGRLAALAGIVFVVCNVVAIVIQGPPPPSASQQEILDWFADNGGALEVASFLGIISMVALLCWFASLWQRWSRAETASRGLLILAASALAGGLALYGAWNAVVSAVSLQASEIDPATAKLMYVLASVAAATAGAFLATHVGAVSAIGLRSAVLPRWMSLFGAIPAVLLAIGTMSTMTQADPAGLPGFLGFVTWLLWILAVSVQMWRTADAD